MSKRKFTQGDLSEATGRGILLGMVLAIFLTLASFSVHNLAVTIQRGIELQAEQENSTLHSQVDNYRTYIDYLQRENQAKKELE